MKKLRARRTTAWIPRYFSYKKGLGQFQRFKAASAFRSLIENWHVSDFHISEARGSKDALYAEHLSPTGDNMAIVAQYINQRTSRNISENPR